MKKKNERAAWLLGVVGVVCMVLSAFSASEQRAYADEGDDCHVLCAQTPETYDDCMASCCKASCENSGDPAACEEQCLQKKAPPSCGTIGGQLCKCTNSKLQGCDAAAYCRIDPTDNKTCLGKSCATIPTKCIGCVCLYDEDANSTPLCWCRLPKKGI